MSTVLNSVCLFLFEKSCLTFGNKSDVRFSLITTVGNKTNSFSLLRVEGQQKNGVTALVIMTKTHAVTF